MEGSRTASDKLLATNSSSSSSSILAGGKLEDADCYKNPEIIPEIGGTYMCCYWEDLTGE